jgi:PhnB protein
MTSHGRLRPCSAGPTGSTCHRTQEHPVRVHLNPYLNFRDQTREAMTFYKDVFGGDLTMNTFADFHAREDPAEADKIMHSQLETPDGMVLMAADLPNSMDLPEASPISISLSGDDDPTLSRWYDALADGGTVLQPLEPAPWGDKFGMCVDRFGVTWLVNIAGAAS